jgi:hypothetical protein
MSTRFFLSSILLASLACAETWDGGPSLGRPAPEVRSPRDPWQLLLSVEAHGTVLSGLSDGPLVGLNVGWAVRAGALAGHWGLFMHVEQSLWQGTEYAAKLEPGTLNAGPGVEYRFAGGVVRSSLSAGVSVLLFDTQLDRRGSVGAFVDLRPVGLRWQLSPGLGIGLDPISFVALAPVLSGLPLIRLQYRTTLVFEVRV